MAPPPPPKAQAHKLSFKDYTHLLDELRKLTPPNLRLTIGKLVADRNHYRNESLRLESELQRITQTDLFRPLEKMGPQKPPQEPETPRESNYLPRGERVYNLLKHGTLEDLEAYLRWNPSDTTQSLLKEAEEWEKERQQQMMINPLK